MFQYVASYGIPVVVENPAGSKIWLTKLFRELLGKHRSLVFDHCAFGGSSKKATRLLFANLELEDLAITCRM